MNEDGKGEGEGNGDADNIKGVEKEDNEEVRGNKFA